MLAAAGLHRAAKAEGRPTRLWAGSVAAGAAAALVLPFQQQMGLQAAIATQQVLSDRSAPAAVRRTLFLSAITSFLVSFFPEPMLEPRAPCSAPPRREPAAPRAAASISRTTT